MGGHIAVIQLIVAFVMWHLSAASLDLADRFANEGNAASARIEDKYSETTRDADGDQVTRYYLELSFETEDGQSIKLSKRVGRSHFSSVEKGEVIDVTYLRSDPGKIELSDGETLNRAKGEQFMFYLFLAFALTTFWYTARMALDAFQARKSGERQEVEVSEIRKARWWQFRVGYRLVWHERDGRQGTSLSQSADRLMGFRTGDRLIVFRGRLRSWWAGDCGDRDVS